MQSTRGIVYEYGPGVITGNIVPLSNGQIDLGSADATFGTVWCTNIIGSISDSLIDCDQLRFPLTGPVTHRLLVSGGNLTADNGSGGNITLAVGNVRANIITAAGDLSLNPTGTNININSKTLNSVGNMITTNNITTIGAPKIRLFQSGLDIYGFGLQPNTLSYETVPTGSNHVFYVTNTERLRINASALQLSVPITTASGDLVLNPAGGNVDFSGKTIINAVVSGNSVQSGPTNLTSTNWSGNITFRFARTGNICVISMNGGVTATAINNIWINSSAIPVGFRPVFDTSVGSSDVLNTYAIKVAVTVGGGLLIQKIPTSNWAISDNLNVQLSISYIV